MSDAAEAVEPTAVAPTGDNAGAGSDPTPITPAPSDWRDSLPDPVKGWQEVETSKDEGAFWEQMSNMRSAIGQSLRIPSQEAGEEAWADFKARIADVPGVMFYDQNDPTQAMNALGRPQDPGGYNFTEVEGFDADPEVEGEFKALAHEIGMTAEMADKVHGWLANNIAEEQRQTQQQYQQDMNMLKGEWGAAFDQNTALARNAVIALDQKVSGFADYLEQSGAGNSTQFIKVMAELGKMFGEQGMMQYQESTAMSPHEARLQIEEIRNNPEHPYNDEMSSAHEAAKEKVRQLYKYATASR